MKNYFNELNSIIILHAISNIAEAVYAEYPENAEAEKAFDEAYKAEWNAVEALVEELAPELGGKVAARAAIWKYRDTHKKAYRDGRGKLMISIDDLNKKTADIARKYYAPDINAVYLYKGVEYTLGAESFNGGLVHFVGFSKHENLFVPADNLGSFLPSVASDGSEITKKAV